MNLYQINVPVFTNGGARNYEAERERFEAFLLATADGFTRMPGNGFNHGVWRDGDKVCRGPMLGYQVAAYASQFDAIVEKWFELFADHHAIFAAKIGTVRIIRRPAGDV